MLLEETKSISIKDLKLPYLPTTKKKVLYRLKLYSVYDVLTHFPIRYEDRTEIKKFSDVIKEISVSSAGKVNATVIAKVIEHQYASTKSGQLLKVIVTDGEIKGELVCYNRDFLSSVLTVGKEFIITGNWEYRYNRLQCATFDYVEVDNEGYKKDEFGVVLPIYSSTEGVRQRTIRKIIHAIVNEFVDKIDDELPEYVMKTRNLLPLGKVIRILHSPKKIQHVEIARKNFVYYEFMKMNILIEYNRSQEKKIDKGKRYSSSKLAEEFVSELPFELTEAQKRVMEEIRRDMFSEKVMHRLLQGDVGSGKTIVALYSALIAVENGFQVAFMVPTEVLATQHYLNITNLLNKFAKKHNINVRLLKGGLPNQKRRMINFEMEMGKSNIVIGTHALFQEDVSFRNLGLVIIDEQHRFGVEQRASLISKGNYPDTLVMTATPIPRTLTMTLYGTLDLSVIDELPYGRKKIITKWYRKDSEDTVYNLVREELKKGFKAYFIYPIIEESDELVDVKSLVEAYEYLSKQVFPDYGVGILHGRMTPEEKYEVMQAFRNGEIKVLASTTVVEVGIDVPDATVIVIEQAERYGLSQLHQLRGRVGRGPYQSYCYLITSEKISKDAVERMKAMTKYEDGFTISEIDLRLRGPGELLGYQQSGLTEFILADLINDEKILLLTREDARNIIQKDIDLAALENHKFRELVNRERKRMFVVKSG
ncbi:MAG: ATP-dependent DNA helicase RecG [Spirochaetia bacterium]|nr:ATP-dependent DNA helicase RecG [Spirochaetota bacterium]MDW8113177.1 ATP-dependent DNA helicase RecG [Spirochaetia bacterium]